MAEFKINQPANCNFADIKHEFVQSADCIIDTATYPNGFVLKLTQYADRVDIWTNRPLIKISESEYQIPD